MQEDSLFCTSEYKCLKNYCHTPGWSLSFLLLLLSSVDKNFTHTNWRLLFKFSCRRKLLCLLRTLVEKIYKVRKSWNKVLINTIRDWRERGIMFPSHFVVEDVLYWVKSRECTFLGQGSELRNIVDKKWFPDHVPNLKLFALSFCQINDMTVLSCIFEVEVFKH